jgi:hypothetical protein
MAGQLLPPPELAPTVPQTATPAQCVKAWFDLMDFCEELLLSGLRHDVGPNGDLRAAYRRWYAEQNDEHDRTIVRMLTELSRREQRRPESLPDLPNQAPDDYVLVARLPLGNQVP